MSWATVRAALKTRLEAVSGVENVHGQLRYDHDGLDEDKFEELFIGAGEVVNTWQFTRTTRTAQRSPDLSTVTKVQHAVTLRGNRSVVDPGTGTTNTEDGFQDTIDAICDNLDDGDRTLGGVAITHSIPQAGQIGHAMFYNSVLCHDVSITFTVEENA